MDADFSIRQLRYFMVVAEELNFTRAAERLQIAQPPLSRQIQSLEQTLRFTLLERTNRRVALTPAGEVFLAECRQILNQMEQGIRAARRVAHGEAGQLFLGFEGAAHNQLILEIIRQFRTQFPDVELIMQEMPSGKQVEALQQEQLDMGLIEPIAAEDGLKVAPLLSEPLIVALADSHPLTCEEHIDLSQLADEPWVTGRSNDGCGLLLRLLDACHQAGFAPKVKQETNDLLMTLGFVASGLGITLLPKSSRLAQAGIAYRPIQPPTPEVQLAIAWHQQSPVVESFLQVVEACYGVKLNMG
ncbi:family transcriptional regulator [Leptolyngbya sp. Heron Island J]|uniref:LysR substrate-binding domain-containing protein n=1 Tax=Leptolyngbya sp. Heron Island J TaxID=1385935 RepID=UPI0003B94F78|nr:LysR substrate-binding domain-containing protein [Leptolyngbya sp. Heron Island J]ESA38203.1 family transcriptional regulator [Leptolyngbya sp. Heron Island J]